ncbi:hypothetical protein [uncultured Veillonella sp.]|uniref:hypothetical protein n=1 Tax=uncultured Veillonella sp. TaxID=159268 RepID=UPI0028D4EE10|nr:hypothetical protein [uncultured Veillonella sp.]
MKWIYTCLAGVLILSTVLSPVYAKDLVAHSGVSGGAKDKCVSSKQTNDNIEADLQRHLERLKSEDMAKGYLGDEKTYAQEVSLIRGRLYHSTDKLIHDERKTTLLSYPVGSKVPCKKSLNDIDSYTDTITRKGITFRVPKGAELKVFYIYENQIYLDYALGDIEYIVAIRPLDVDHPDTKDIENKALVDKEYNFYHPLQVYWRMWGIFDELQNPTYSAVWNNGLPGMLVDSYHPDEKSHLVFAAFDGRYAVFNQLVYNPSTSPFTHEQLRNTIEYFDSNNNPEYKDKKHRLFPDERIIRIYEY